ncbi:MAG: hypothetical protein HS115_02370 [Spirochaetales bacterium]|nr:hypothetical protein [Spirochaetales bacterium]
MGHYLEWRSPATYLDGDPTTTATGAYTWAGGVNGTADTGQYAGGGEYWQGQLDELRISNTARSAQGHSGAQPETPALPVA